MQLFSGRRWCMICGLLILCVPASILAQERQQTSTPDLQLAGSTNRPSLSSVAIAGQAPTTPASAVSESALVELPDSPGAVQYGPQSQEQQANPAPAQSPAQTAPANPIQQAAPTQSSDQQNSPQTAPQRPVGTAAAESPTVSGITAAQPAGVAIAPAKQRRVRTIVLKVGAIVGAGVAVGTVVALTAGTPSKPPGAR